MEKTSKNCQSCGMPLNKDPQGSGTNSDGTKSTKYCSLCYQAGNFLSPEIDTPEKMQKFCLEKMNENGMNKIMAWIFTRGIPKLERWKK